MRGNRYARGGDPMKTRSQKRKEKKAKLDKTNRVQRLKKRLGRITAKKFARQQDSHTTALMESYILRRKEERAAERKKKEAEEMAAKQQEEGGGASPETFTNDELYDMYEEDVFAEDNPRAQHKRMKDLMKGIRPVQPKPSQGKSSPQGTRRPQNIPAAQDRRSSNVAGGANRGQERAAGGPNSSQKSARKSRPQYDPRNRRVQTRSLY